MYYLCSENKGADQIRGYREADLRLCFRICKVLVSSRTGSCFIYPLSDLYHTFSDPYPQLPSTFSDLYPQKIIGYGLYISIIFGSRFAIKKTHISTIHYFLCFSSYYLIILKTCNEIKSSLTCVYFAYLMAFVSAYNCSSKRLC